MKRMLTIGGVLALAVALVIAALPSGAADHLDAPAVQADGRLDINDLYAFQSPSNPANTVLVMTVNPLAGVLSPTSFHPNAWYDFRIDNDGDAVEDLRYSLRFQRVGPDGSQALRVHAPGLVGSGHTGEDVALRGGGRVRAGVFDDPFFFDLQAFRDQVKGAGGSNTFCDDDPNDFFRGFNVAAVVLEVPSAELGDHIGVWATTRIDDTVRDRMGRPAIATVLIPDGEKDAFNTTAPQDDVATWGEAVASSLSFLSGLDGSGYTPAQADALAQVLLPDVLTLDTTSAAGFVPGLNGRRLADDVIDLELLIVTGGLFDGSPVLTSDCVDTNDVPFPTTFPYLASGH